ncbi:MAG: hydantoinase B/oxoprolinase family protein [Pirellulales bacterium]|nr:hydantoinase B/oxoprolinase family protein [Pirellulales bacterium]
MPWQCWIDVGGTFTDCIARRPDGRLLRHKILSSGVTKGAAASGSDRSRIVDPLRHGDPGGFWVGYRIRLLDHAGSAAAEAEVAEFDRSSGTLRLAPELPFAPREGQPYELTSVEEAPIIGIRYLLGLRRDEAIPAMVVRLGTTRGTNALITRRGAKTAFITTKGFGDVLRIGYQNRPKLFELSIRKPPPLFAEVVEIVERVTAGGQVLVAPDPKAVREQLIVLKTHGIESLAVCLLHAYIFAEHEELVGRIAGEVGFEEVSLSHRVAPLVKIVARGDTTVMDAYLNPVLRAYVQRLRQSLGAGRLQILTSAGGLVDADRFVGKDSILSGPAGGVVGFSRVARTAGFDRAIGFDMGGTSTDVSRFDGRYEMEYETEKAGVRVVAPMMAIETVAAGGGSICGFDGVKLVVGPDSAGAYPGPACYGRGGPLAVTDMNVFLGKILPDHFPFPLDRSAVESRLASLCDEIAGATGTRYTPHELADGFLRVANANMAKAIRSISVVKGCDPREYVLVPFGGAAGQHACAVARELGMRQVLNHPDAGILSAYGIGMADVVCHRVAGVYTEYSEQAACGLREMFDRLADEACREVLHEDIPADRIEVRRSLDLRYRGLDAYRTIPEPDRGTYAEAFAAEHEKLYGYAYEGRPLEIVAARVEVVGRSACEAKQPQPAAVRQPAPQRTTQTWFEGRHEATVVFIRQDLRPGDRIGGPAIVCEDHATTVIDPDWTADMLPGGELLLWDRSDSRPDEVSTATDPTMLEIFNNQFAGIAEQMGITLRNTSTSVNVKERLDFSCAIFTPAGDLVVNAPHIPVHLGAMGETVRNIVADNPEIRPGDVFVTNDPYRGGAHLPDVTVVTPVHDRDAGDLLFFTASRAHHAEIGGIVPGSMPPFSRNLAEEGVLIANFKLVAAGCSRLDELREILLGAKHPTRSVDDNLADIAAQTAANRQGAGDLVRMVERYTLPVVRAYMGHIQAAAERKLRTALGRLPDGRYQFVDRMDDGSPITVAVEIRGDEAGIDFAGTGPVVPGNLNANRAIVTAAVMYCLRCLIDEDIPLNQGVLAPIRIVLPECMLNPPRRETPEACAAVVGGNVETSQRVVDCLLGALGVAAASQGTMNNVLFGDGTFGYYETICGGAGATRGTDGADAVHTHMTNTRLTDPEVLEQRYPVRVQEFSIRRGSGGKGRHHGGDGVVRRLQFLRSLDLSVLSQRRGPYAPFGLAGGSPGALGRNMLVRADGRREHLPGAAQCRVEVGDVLIVETPGGGGYGSR